VHEVMRQKIEIEELGVNEITFFQDPKPGKSDIFLNVQRRANEVAARTGKEFSIRCYGFEYAVRRLK